MRPESHRDMLPDNRCGNCRFARLIKYHNDWLCFYGDEIQDGSEGFVIFQGEDVAFLEGDAYDTVWSGRVVDADIDTCDQWEPCHEPG